MAPPKTRARFLDHQKAIRPGVSEKTFIREWNQKDQNQKANWLIEFGHLEHDRNYRAQEEETFWASLRLFKQELAKSLIERDTYNRKWAGAMRCAQNLRTAERTLKTRYLMFRTFENGQPGSSDDGRQWSSDEAVNRVLQIAVVNLCIRWLQSRKNGRLTPRDQNGQMRIPGPWCPRPLREILNKRGQDTGLENGIEQSELGVELDDGEGVWLPWFRLVGGMAKGFLWLKFDSQNPDGRMIDRVFRKDAELSQKAWIEPTHWDGDVRDFDSRLPYELACNDALQRAGLPYVVRIRGEVHQGLMDNEKCKYKVYLEWCPHKDLEDLITHQPDDSQIPEPFIWYVAEALAIAGCYMHEGGMRDGSSTLDPEWRQIVHRDIKPGNVFLDAPDSSGIYPEYPKAVLGDFGCAIKTSLNDPYNRRWYVNTGTDGFMAPEQLSWLDHDTLEPMLDRWKINSKTNVFAMGMVLRCLLLGFQDLRQPLFLGNGHHDTSLMMRGIEDYYNVELVDLVRSCLAFGPAFRPTFRQLLTRIRSYTNEDEDEGYDIAQGMRSGAATQETLEEEGLVLPDPYRVNLCRDGSDGLPGQFVGNE